MKRTFVIFACLVVLTVMVLGVRGMINSRRPLMVFSDMDFQPRYRPQGESRFFADGRAQRTPPKGTVAYGGADYTSDAGKVSQNSDMLQADSAYYRGKAAANTWVKNAPVERPTIATLRSGRKTYDTYCAICHGATGAGNGIMKEYGFAEVANLLDKRILSMPDGQLYHTIVNGKGLMQGYRHQIEPRDRWATVLYVRALQISQTTKWADLPEPHKTELAKEE